MSDQTSFGISVFDRRFRSFACRKEEAELLFPGPQPYTWEGAPPKEPSRYMLAFTRNGHFMVCARELLDASGIEGLRFLSNQSSTHRREEPFDLDDIDDEDEFVLEEKWGEVHEYTLLTGSEISNAIVSIRRLRDWCRECLAEAAKILEARHSAELLECMEGAFYTARPNNDVPEAEYGTGPLFFFSVLRTIEDLLLLAAWSNKSSARDFDGYFEHVAVYKSISVDVVGVK